MDERRLELADIVGEHGPEFLSTFGPSLQPEQRAALRAISLCRTAALGGHVDECDACGHREISYNSCRNRHCPKCQALARARWVEARAAELLPVPYFHVVFTLPDQLAHLALQNKRVVYDLLFASAWDAMRSIAADPKHLGAEIGCLMILHTWGQTLTLHPHVHCVVPGGGLSPDGERWVACRDGFFLPVRVLSRRFRTLFLAGLRRATERGELVAVGALEGLLGSERFERVLSELRGVEWVVYAKAPFGSPAQVLKYLGRYTHRIAISNNRLMALEDARVRFTYKDYRRGNERREMELSATEFLRRFLLHVVPKGFKRIRQYGLLANRSRSEKLARCQELLGPHVPPAEPAAALLTSVATAERRCPQCGDGVLREVEQLGRRSWIGARRPRVVEHRIDSS